MTVEQLKNITERLGFEFKEEQVNGEHQCFIIDGTFFIDPTDEPVIRKCIGGLRDTGLKKWNVSIVTYDAGSRDEPPSQDVADVCMEDCLDDAVRTCLKKLFEMKVDGTFTCEYEAQLHLDIYE